MDKLLIIGASIGQLPLLKKAKERGIHVTVASIPGNYCCFEYANDIIEKDIYDRDEIVEEAKRKGITAVISDQNDLMMPTVAYVAEKMGLPGNSFDTVMTYCNKNQFRNLCDKAGVPCPKHIAVNSEEYDFSDFNCPFPWIVKPADSQSSIGIKKINHLDELRTALYEALSKSPTHTAIVEEFFEGREVVCEGFINEGIYYLLSFGDRRYFDLKDAMIPCQTLFPSTISNEVQNKIIGYEEALTNLSKPSFAIVHSEYLINESTGDIRIVESALRGGGVYISSDLIPLATGIDINEALLSKALGEKINIDEVFSKRKKLSSAYVCFYLQTGFVSSVEGLDKINQRKDIVFADINKIQSGYVSEKMKYKGMRLGPFVIKGTNRNDIENTIRWLQDSYIVRMNDRIENAIIWK